MTGLKPWSLLEESVLEVRGPFSLVSAMRENPRNGAATEFLRIDCVDWIATIPLTAKGEVVLIRQYRSGVDSICTEIPAGCILSGEDIENGAKRELEEETGYVAGRFEALGFIHPNPGLMPVKCHIFVAYGATKHSTQNLDEGEDIEVILRPLQDIPDMLRSGEITHSLIIAAFTLLMCKHPELLSAP